MTRPTSTHDQLDELELNIARRADEIARAFPTRGCARRDRETWSQAEAEVLARSSRTGDRPQLQDA